MRDVSQVITSGMCAGCGLCVRHANQMKIDSHGYLRPELVIEDAISNQVCPGRGVMHHNVDARYVQLWGPILSCQVGHACDESVRHQGSSGGVLTALLMFLVNSAHVDAVIQVGVSQDNPIRNETYIHSSAEDILSCAGSRYAPSAPLSIIREVLGNGKRYAVVGKPCDIAAMRSLLHSFPEYQQQFPYLLTFMCAGVPSEEGTKAVLNKFGVTEEQLISFRYRGDGWPGLTKAVSADGVEHTMTYNESWGTILNRHLQPRCKLCADGIGEAADIVCGDAWHASNNGYPSFEEQAGRSLTIARTLQGRNLLDEALAAGILSLKEYPIEDLKQIQPYQATRKQTALVRKLAVTLLGGHSPSYKGYKLNQLFFNTPLKITIKAFAGTLARKFRGRI